MNSNSCNHAIAHILCFHFSYRPNSDRNWNFSMFFHASFAHSAAYIFWSIQNFRIVLWHSGAEDRELIGLFEIKLDFFSSSLITRKCENVCSNHCNSIELQPFSTIQNCHPLNILWFHLDGNFDLKRVLISLYG